MNEPVYTTADKLAAIEHELKYRRDVYPRWIAKGKIDQAYADKQIAIFEAIAADYREQVQKEKLL